MANIEMVIDSIKISQMNYQRVVILREKEGERYLPCWIGPAEADAIAVKMQGVSVPRPLTHDFVCQIIDSLGGKVVSAIIDKLKNDTFYAKLIVSINDKQKQIDCRPSDALAVAIRKGIPVFADDKVLKKAATLLDRETGKPIGTGVTAAEIESDKYGIFSESAQDILSLAEKEAKRLNHDFVGTGHLLLALVKGIPTTASEVLNNLGIELTKMPVEIEIDINQHLSIESVKTGLTSAIKETIELSIAEAKRLGAGQVQTEHILLGLIRQKDGIASNLLKNRGIDVDSVYIELIRSYNQPGYRQQEPPEWKIKQS